MNKMDKLCKGCLSHERVGEYIPSNLGIKYGECPGYNTKDVDCPCQHCLVKAMCDTICDDIKKTKWFRGQFLIQRNEIIIGGKV